MRFALYCYLSIGLVFAAFHLLRDRGRGLQKSTVTVLKKGGQREVKETRNSAEYFLTIVFDVLLWWVPLLFWTLYVPWHDRRAEKSYLQTLVDDPQAWVPPRLETEVQAAREAKKTSD